jgi:hypothetical protein
MGTAVSVDVPAECRRASRRHPAADSRFQLRRDRTRSSAETWRNRAARCAEFVGWRAGFVERWPMAAREGVARRCEIEAQRQRMQARRENDLLPAGSEGSIGARCKDPRPSDGSIAPPVPPRTHRYPQSVWWRCSGSLIAAFQRTPTRSSCRAPASRRRLHGGCGGSLHRHRRAPTDVAASAVRAKVVSARRASARHRTKRASHCEESDGLLAQLVVHVALRCTTLRKPRPRCVSAARFHRSHANASGSGSVGPRKGIRRSCHRSFRRRAKC